MNKRLRNADRIDVSLKRVVLRPPQRTVHGDNFAVKITAQFRQVVRTEVASEITVCVVVTTYT